MITWRLKKGGDRRVRGGHPWVFAGELAHSAREARPGELIELRDDRGHFVAYGYGHPTSAIAFRKLSSRAKESDVMSVDFFRRRLAAARELRRAAGWADVSHRWIFAEADGAPGVIIDAFKLDDGWAAVVQASTAGAEAARDSIFAALKTFVPDFGALRIIEAPSSRARLAEGLTLGPRRVVDGAPLDAAGVRVHLIDGLTMHADLLGGQKTGFFLDQQWNARLLRRTLASHLANSPAQTVRVLDVCCYVGQWAAHATEVVRALGKTAAVTLVDVSASALDLAERNLAAAGAHEVTRVEGDALRALDGLAGDYDVIICDPPAFVKKKADLEAGLRAYVKLNRDALKLARPGSLFVASSCSGLVRTAEYQRVVAEAATKAGRLFQQMFAGGHAPDHPVRPEFPEGEYLKASIGRVDYPF